MKTLFLALLIPLAGCTPFVRSNQTETTVGVTINHEKAINFVFNLFAKKESVSFVNEK